MRCRALAVWFELALLTVPWPSSPPGPRDVRLHLAASVQDVVLRDLRARPEHRWGGHVQLAGGVLKLGAVLESARPTGTKAALVTDPCPPPAAPCLPPCPAAWCSSRTAARTFARWRPLSPRLWTRAARGRASTSWCRWGLLHPLEGRGITVAQQDQHRAHYVRGCRGCLPPFLPPAGRQVASTHLPWLSTPCVCLPTASPPAEPAHLAAAAVCVGCDGRCGHHLFGSH